VSRKIISKLHEVEVILSWGDIVAMISKKIGVSGYTYYR
jgi:hypothetical protein